MSRLLASAFTLLLCLPISGAEFQVLNPPSPNDPVYVIPPGICGNGVVEDGEECDPGYPDLGVEPDLGGATCETQGFNGGGEVSCTSKCTVDDSACDCETGTKFPATGQTRCWDWLGNEIECTGTGHDGDNRAGEPLAYIDNGDGTITDENTGLMWEKKYGGGGVHNYNSKFSWEEATSRFIGWLNDTCEGENQVSCSGDEDCGPDGQCGLAGYRDWRVPNIRELHSIVDFSRRFPAVHPAFGSFECYTSPCLDCSCTLPGQYWSSTTMVGAPFRSWTVNFNDGYVNRETKSIGVGVRAVRGGLD